MQEKDAALSDDYGKHLASMQALHMKLEGFQVKDHHTAHSMKDFR